MFGKFTKISILLVFFAASALGSLPTTGAHPVFCSFIVTGDTGSLAKGLLLEAADKREDASLFPSLLKETVRFFDAKKGESFTDLLSSLSRLPKKKSEEIAVFQILFEMRLLTENRAMVTEIERWTNKAFVAQFLVDAAIQDENPNLREKALFTIGLALQSKLNRKQTLLPRLYVEANKIDAFAKLYEMLRSKFCGGAASSPICEALQESIGSYVFIEVNDFHPVKKKTTNSDELLETALERISEQSKDNTPTISEVIQMRERLELASRRVRTSSGSVFNYKTWLIPSLKQSTSETQGWQDETGLVWKGYPLYDESGFVLKTQSQAKSSAQWYGCRLPKPEEFLRLAQSFGSDTAGLKEFETLLPGFFVERRYPKVRIWTSAPGVIIEYSVEEGFTFHESKNPEKEYGIVMIVHDPN